MTDELDLPRRWIDANVREAVIAGLATNDDLVTFVEASRARRRITRPGTAPHRGGRG